MGVDDEYRAVASAEDSNEHLLEKSGPITRSAYKKRSMFASLAFGCLIGAAIMFLISAIFSPAGTTFTKAAAASTSAPATTSVAQEKALASATPTASKAASAGKTVAADKLDIKDCGTNPTEARAKGCIFDVMMQLWMHPDCYDEKLSERYLASGNWTWWADTDASKQLSLLEMRKGEHPVIYVVQDYHKQHCIFAWEKLVRAMRNEQPLIEELISYDHVMHCKHRTLSKEDDSVRGVRAPTGYTRCALYSTWLQNLPANAVSSVE